MRKTIPLALFMVLLLGGCHRQAEVPHIYVVLIDLSASIEPQARSEAFSAIVQLTRSMKRGDRMSIIPVAGDAATQTQGRVLRLDLSTERQAYDQDIKQFVNKAVRLLQETEHVAAGKPTARTDLFGSVHVAEQEIALATSHLPVLIILSDFLQDDQTANFNVIQKVATSSKGDEFGKSMAISKAVHLHAVPVYLGWLRSPDVARLDASRREGVQAFWLSFFKQGGAIPFAATDGSGLLMSFVQAKGG